MILMRKTKRRIIWGSILGLCILAICLYITQPQIFEKYIPGIKGDIDSTVTVVSDFITGKARVTVEWDEEKSVETVEEVEEVKEVVVETPANTAGGGKKEK